MPVVRVQQCMCLTEPKMPHPEIDTSCPLSGYQYHMFYLHSVQTNAHEYVKLLLITPLLVQREAMLHHTNWLVHRPYHFITLRNENTLETISQQSLTHKLRILKDCLKSLKLEPLLLYVDIYLFGIRIIPRLKICSKPALCRS